MRHQIPNDDSLLALLVGVFLAALLVAGVMLSDGNIRP